jgi:LPXTG-motif cell wall-anchored protein
MQYPGHASILETAGSGMLAATGPESIGYIIIAIGLVGLGLALVMLMVVNRRRQHHR